MESTKKLFVTLWSGRVVEIPLFKHECGDIVPEDFRIDVEITRRWMDHLLKNQLRRAGVPIVSASLIMSGEVIERERIL
jgi:hypothetical protein